MKLEQGLLVWSALILTVVVVGALALLVSAEAATGTGLTGIAGVLAQALAGRKGQ